MSCRRQALVRYGNTQHTDQVFVPGVGQAHNKISISISKQSCFLTVTCEINPICNTNEIYQCKKKKQHYYGVCCWDLMKMELLELVVAPETPASTTLIRNCMWSQK